MTLSHSRITEPRRFIVQTCCWEGLAGLHEQANAKPDVLLRHSFWYCLCLFMFATSEDKLQAFPAYRLMNGVLSEVPLAYLLNSFFSAITRE
jgi:hypothetical protein